MRGQALIVATVLAGCRIGFDPGGGGAGDAGSDASRDAAALPCGSTYTFAYGTSKYRIAGTDMWRNSELDCESDGSGHHLAIIDNAAELTGLAPLSGTTVTWIGVTDNKTEGTWLTVTGVTAPYTPWAPGKGLAGGPNCVSWDPATNLFTDQVCTVDHDRICECDGVGVDPTAY